ncbi:hypothetical protein [Nocardia alni]|nr:hypothetical protein [Nocardia alni]
MIAGRLHHGPIALRRGDVFGAPEQAPDSSAVLELGLGTAS